MIINGVCFFFQDDSIIKRGNKYMYISVIQIAFDAAYNCFQKYMMEKFYYPYWSIAFVPGIIQLIIGISGLIIELTISSQELYSFLKDNKLGIFLKIILPFILHIIMCPLFILIIYYFKPDFILIIYQLAVITKNIMDNLKYPVGLCVCISMGIMQILVLMIYLEILELNFCRLNENTQRNIDLRSQDDFYFEGRDSSSSLKNIDINREYSIEAPEKIESETELEVKNEGEEENESEDEKINDN